MATVEMSFTPLPVHVRTARLVATAVARRSGVDEALLDEVRLAVGEACSRAVEAHQAQCPTEPVRIELTGIDGRFEVVVTDAVAAAVPDGLDGLDGAAGEPSGWQQPVDGTANGTANGHRGPAPVSRPSGTAPAPAPAGTASAPPGLPADQAGGVPPYGLGLAVIAGLADDVQFSRTPSGLSIRMSWPSGRRPA
jgi:serine/threonine-protein kinase RsbW